MTGLAEITEHNNYTLQHRQRIVQQLLLASQRIAFQRDIDTRIFRYYTQFVEETRAWTSRNH
jgi:hypothetical protein